MPLWILNTSDETQTIGAQTAVAVARPVTDVAELDISEMDFQYTNRTSKWERSLGTITRSTQ